jgi:hypothetical protein
MPRVADVARQVAVFLLPAIVSLYCDLGFHAGLRSGFSVCDSDFNIARLAAATGHVDQMG